MGREWVEWYNKWLGKWVATAMIGLICFFLYFCIFFCRYLTAYNKSASAYNTATMQCVYLCTPGNMHSLANGGKFTR